MTTETKTTTFNYYTYVFLLTATVGIPEWYRYEFGTVASIVLGVVVWGQLLFSLAVAFFIYRFGTAMEPDNINVNPGSDLDVAESYLESFKNEEGPTHYFFTRLRAVIFMSVGFMSIGVMIPMVKNGSMTEIAVVIATSALAITGGVSALEAFRDAIKKLSRDITIV